MPRYLEMLRAKKLFGPPGGSDRPLGMPEIDDGNVAAMFRSVVPLAESLKTSDMQRAKEMMEFEASLKRRMQPQPGPVMPPPKKNVVYGGTHPLTSMQKEFQADRQDATKTKTRMAELAATQSGALNNALATGRQRSQADMAKTTAELASAERVATTNREAQIKAQQAQREFTATQNDKNRADKGWQTYNIADPNDPTKQIAVRTNLATGVTERVQLDDKTIGGLNKPGTPKAAGGVALEPMKAIKDSAQDALAEIQNLISDDDKLTDIAQSAVGKSRMNPLGYMPGSPKREGDASINRVKAQQVIGVIAQMKAQSKTGATGFGAMNMRELKILEDAASKLDPMLGEEAFSRELVRVRNILRKVLEEPVADKAGAGSTNSADVDKRADDIIKAARGGR